MRFLIYNRNYDEDYDWEKRHPTRVPLDKTTEPWVVESLDGGAAFHYATHEDAISSIYEGSKRG